MRVSDGQDVPAIIAASRERKTLPMSGAVLPGVRLGTSEYVTSTLVTYDNGSTSSSSFTGNLRSSHQQYFLSSNPIVNGRRRNSTYIMHALRVRGKSYDYQYTEKIPWVGSQTTRFQSEETDIKFALGPPPSMAWWGTKVMGGMRIPDVSNNMKNQTITECLNKLSDSKVNALVAFAEGVKTVDFISGIVMKIVRSYMQIRKGNWNQALRVLTGSKPGKNLNKDPASAWLQWQYAAMPLLSDIHGAYGAFQRGVRDNGMLITATRRLEQSWYPPNISPFKVLNQGGGVKVMTECKLVAEVSSSSKDAMNSLGLMNPLLVLWEIVPYSFVIDWLLPIGSWLQGLTAPIGISYLDGYLCTKTVSDIQIIGHLESHRGAIGSFPGVTVHLVCLYREALATMPISRPYIRSPFSTNRVISAIALLSNLRK